MNTMPTTNLNTPEARFVAAGFLQPDDAERAIGALHDHGVSSRQISVATRSGSGDGEATDTLVLSDAPPVVAERDGFMDVQVDMPSVPTDMNAATDSRRGGSSTSVASRSLIAAEGVSALTTTTPADAARGAVGGGVVGLGVGLIAGLAALTIPGVGPILAAGPLWIAIAGTTGAAAGGAAAGGVAGYLRDMGVPDDVAHYHAESLRAGTVVVTIHLGPHDEAATITGILRKYGGIDIAPSVPA